MQYGEDLAVTVTSADGTVLITAVGEMDAFSRTRLVGAISRALDGSMRRVVVDVAGLTFIDATSYTALISLTSHAESEGTSLVFRNPHRSFLRARELIDGGSVVKVDPDR